MAGDVGVSVIIPTYNRRELVQRALRSVLAQTAPVDEIIVVDDGSTDGTGEALAAAFGDRIVYVRQANAGVSAARNRGLSMARGRFITLLDSDDEWLPEKTRVQREWLEARPGFGMVLCDVQRVAADGQAIDVLSRRRALPEDGMVLRHLVRDAALVPASVMIRREVYESVGGFDETLATGEDLDWHLRIGARHPIGVVEQPLVRALRGHDGLSSLARTWDDYLRVMERAIDAARAQLDARDCDAALANASLRAARGRVHARRWREAWRLAVRAWRLDASRRGEVLGLLPLALRRVLAKLRGKD
jgi:glycosyltransferase involved in cell wall biosynthesis